MNHSWLFWGSGSPPPTPRYHESRSSPTQPCPWTHCPSECPRAWFPLSSPPTINCNIWASFFWVNLISSDCVDSLGPSLFSLCFDEPLPTHTP